MYRITYNTCISETRKRRHRFSLIDDAQTGGFAEEMNLDGDIQENRELVVKAVLDQLPEEEYTLVLLYYYEDQNIEEISHVTGLTESNVKVKLYRIRKKLYTILNDRLKEDVHSIF